jgi:N-acetylmuramic acid 6-phosphate etherase
MIDNLDRLPTEQPNPRTADLDRRDTLGTLALINAEDRTVAAAVAAALPEIARAVDLAVERWRLGGRVVLFGAGTSGRLAALDAAELRPTFGVPPGRYVARMAGGAGAFQVAVEGAEDDLAGGEAAASDLTAADVALGVAASGRTPWVIGALRAARRRGAATVGLACLPGPALAAECDVTIAVETGPEALAGSTRMKAGTAQKLVLNAFSTALMTRLGKVYRNLMVDVQVTNAKLRRRAIRLVGEIAGVDGPTAEQALDAADREVKTAVVALRFGLEPPAARARLASADGSLARALGETDGQVEGRRVEG